MKYLTILLFFFASYRLDAQVDYRARVQENMQLLIKDSTLLKQVFTDDQGIHMRASSSAGRDEFLLRWSEIPTFLQYFHEFDYYEMVEFYNRKGTGPIYYEGKLPEFERELPINFTELRIAIDPGHFAGSWKEALQERKYIKIQGEALGEEEDIEFYESQLTWATYEILKEELESRGATVFVSRDRGESAVGKSFDEWYAEDFETDIKSLKASKDLSPEVANYLLRSQSKWESFKYVYKYMDFVGRSRRINDFKPHITLIIHYNADEYSDRLQKRYWEPSFSNYSMFFVPGGFLSNELRKQDARIEFLRLLVTPDLSASIAMADKLRLSHQEILGVEAYPTDYPSNVLEYFSNYTGIPGVYARNLYLTRAIESPVVYCESLYQDNVDEAKLLAKRDFEINGIKTSTRIKEVANAYIKALEDWIQDNELDYLKN
ncbi:MAG: N-acetylmuramoyl-L-alanine amidase [Bacteroidota bacterium]